MKFFESRTFLIHRSVPQRKFSALWDKKVSIECRDSPFFCINLFHIWHLKLSETLDGSSRSFPLLWDKKNWRKTVICKKVSEIRNILNLRSRSQDFFAYCETKNFEWRTWFSVLMHRKIRYPNISGSLKGLRTKFFMTVRPRLSKENRDTPLLSIKVFDFPKILKQRRIPYWALLAVYVKKIQRRKVISPSYAWNFSIGELFWYTEVFHKEIFRYSEPKNFRRKMVIFRSYSKFFSIPHLWNFLKH